METSGTLNDLHFDVQLWKIIIFVLCKFYTALKMNLFSVFVGSFLFLFDCVACIGFV